MVDNMWINGNEEKAFKNRKKPIIRLTESNNNKGKFEGTIKNKL